MTDTIDPTNSQAQKAYDAARVDADSARAQITAAKQVVTDAGHALSQATAAFRAKPTSATATAKMVAEQVASNALESLELAQAAAKPSLDAESFASMRVTYGSRMIEYCSYLDDLQRDVDLIVSCEAQVREASQRMIARTEKQRATLQGLVASAGALNIPVPEHRLVEPQYLQGLVAKRLTEVYGSTAINYGQVQTMSNWLAFY